MRGTLGTLSQLTAALGYAAQGSNPELAGFARDHRGPTCHSAPLHPDRSAAHALEPRLGQANARPPNPVPPPPAETVYNPGTAQYENLGYHNNGLPRPCRAGSGAPSYSTRRRPRPQVRELGVGGAGSWPVDGA